jgi:hypothetical protein
MRLLVPQLTQLIGADVLDVTGRGVESQPAPTVGVGNSQGPLDVEDVGVRIGDRHHRLGEARGGVRTATHGFRYCHNDSAAKNAKIAFAALLGW